MANNFINTDQLIGSDGSWYMYPNYALGTVGATSRQLNCIQSQIICAVWLLPYVVGTKVTGYTELVAANTATKPRLDAIKALKIRDSGVDKLYYLAIALTDEVSTTTPVSQFAALCNGITGTVPTMPTAPIPFPIIEIGPALTDSYGNNTFYFSVPANPNTLLINIANPTFNGLAPATPYSSTGITTPALLATWANTNWSAYGAWSSSGQLLRLVSNATPPVWVSGATYAPGTTVTSIGVNYVCILATSGTTALASDTTHWTAIGATNTSVQNAGLITEIVPGPNCFNLTAFSTPAPVNQIKFGSAPVENITPFVLTDVNTDAQANIQKYFRDPWASFSTAIAHKLQVNTTMAQPALYYNGTLVVNSTVAVCS